MAEAASHSGHEGTFDRHCKDKTGHQHKKNETQEGDSDISQLLAKKEFDLLDGRRLEVGDGSGLFLLDDAKRGHDGGNEHQHQYDDT
ncbi:MULTISPECIES: hypothetical protein [unclassified Rhizobium]|uniref:hypothetical protein n=1 Tax=unclassified Rhizobium TaxID=2613769 RepID=UPI0037F2AEAC